MQSKRPSAMEVDAIAIDSHKIIYSHQEINLDKNNQQTNIK